MKIVSCEIAITAYFYFAEQLQNETMRTHSLRLPRCTLPSMIFKTYFLPNDPQERFPLTSAACLHCKLSRASSSPRHFLVLDNHVYISLQVLSIDGIPVTHMTRLDCVRRLKESQLVIRLMVRCRGALRPEVVSAERKIERGKVPPELPAAPPPVPPRKLRQPRGSADGDANPSPIKKLWDNSKSQNGLQNGAQNGTQNGSSISQVGLPCVTKISPYENGESSPRSVNGSNQGSPKESSKDRSEFVKSKQVVIMIREKNMN